jgi:VanZ family protein
LRVLASWLILFLYAGMIYLLSSMPSIGEYIPSFPFFDKVVHAVEFGLFSILLFRAMKVSFARASVAALIGITIIISILYGAVDEYHQLFTPFRNADLFDLLADTIGIVMAQGIIVARIKQQS